MTRLVRVRVSRSLTLLVGHMGNTLSADPRAAHLTRSLRSTYTTGRTVPHAIRVSSYTSLHPTNPTKRFVMTTLRHW